jgi:hypothetical protein
MRRPFGIKLPREHREYALAFFALAQVFFFPLGHVENDLCRF